MPRLLLEGADGALLGATVCVCMSCRGLTQGAQAARREGLRLRVICACVSLRDAQGAVPRFIIECRPGGCWRVPRVVVLLRACCWRVLIESSVCWFMLLGVYADVYNYFYFLKEFGGIIGAKVVFSALLRFFL